MTGAHTWAGRQVLVTGHTGFKGSWLVLWLHSLGARVSGLALEPPTDPSLFRLAGVDALLENDWRGDVRDLTAVDRAVAACEPQTVFHLAAQPLVRSAYCDPVSTFATNVTGTVNVLDAVRRSGRPTVVVVVTTDKCYAGVPGPGGYREADPLGGPEPYGASKAAAELVTEAYRASYFPPGRLAEHGVAVASARAGNVIGGGDWSADRLVPDFVRAALAGRPLTVRAPGASRPWQHVVVPLSGYIDLARALAEPGGDRYARAWNFAPPTSDTVSVASLVTRCQVEWPGSSWIAAPDPHGPYEAPELRLDPSQADELLGWRCAWGIERAVGATIAWYRRWAAGSTELRDVCLADITAYEADRMSAVAVGVRS